MIRTERSALIARARDWVADDPDPHTRHELSTLIDAVEAEGSEAGVAWVDLSDRFASVLEFGTAGLRGALGAGPNRMNLAVVIRTAAGLAAWLRSQDDPTVSRRGVVVGYDARHRSLDFALATAEVLASAGIRVHLLPEPLPTPVLAFTVLRLDAAAGVMVTASHNPSGDNGYKVYDATGRQIVAPVDAEIAARIAEVGPVHAVPRDGPDDPDIVRLGSESVDRYVERAAAVRVLPGLPEASQVKVAYTAMHGVGAATVRRVFAAAGFAEPVEVAEQVEPDPDFPTVPFPNPEEPGALELGLQTAAASRADVLLANDPDADRLGVALPLDGAWRTLTGDEIGAVLAHHLISNGAVAEGSVMATTIVSSTLLGRMATAAGIEMRETLTGFKWLTRAADPDGTLAFAYEEALGYAVSDMVRDKDGITAAVLFVEAVAQQASQGRTVLDLLDDLARAHGVHRTGQWSVRVSGPTGQAELAAAMDRVRSEPPVEVAGRSVTEVVDLVHGDPVRGLAASDVLVLHLEGGRVVVRPSGTEPKLKCYVEVVEPVEADLATAHHRADSALAEVIEALPDLVGLPAA